MHVFKIGSEVPVSQERDADGHHQATDHRECLARETLVEVHRIIYKVRIFEDWAQSNQRFASSYSNKQADQISDERPIGIGELDEKYTQKLGENNDVEQIGT